MNLIEEIERHSGDIAHVAEELAEAKAAVYSTAAKLKGARTDLEKEVRADPGSFGIEKTTEAAIGSVIASDPAIRKLEAKLGQAQFEESSKFGELEALRAKTDMLKSLVSLHNTLWFGEPTSGAGAAPKDKKKARLQEID